jgi:hypothetical protein
VSTNANVLSSQGMSGEVRVRLVNLDRECSEAMGLTLMPKTVKWGIDEERMIEEIKGAAAPFRVSTSHVVRTAIVRLHVEMCGSAKRAAVHSSVQVLLCPPIKGRRRRNVA